MPIVRKSLAQARAEARVDPERLQRTGEAEIARQAAEDRDTAPLQEDLAAALAQGEAWVAWPAGRKVKRTVELYPDGTDATKRKQTFEAYIQSYKVSSGVGDAAKYDISLTKTGDTTFTTV